MTNIVQYFKPNTRLVYAAATSDLQLSVHSLKLQVVRSKLT